MKITVISDSHRNDRRLKNAVDANRDSDLFIHLGDGLDEVWRLAETEPKLNFVFVMGNCDRHSYVEENIIEAAGQRIFYTHGHYYGVRSGIKDIVKRCSELKCGILLYGHTHIPKIEYISGIHVMNPGSISTPRGGSRPSYGVVTISEDGAVSMEIVEYKEPCAE